MKKEDIVTVINEKFREYEGYVQFSHRPINSETDIFKDGKKVEITNESGFIYEAHFCNGTMAVTIKQVNDNWRIDETDISKISPQDIQIYHAIGNNKVKMAQIWESENDPLCENLPTKNLKKVLFAGYAKGDNQ